VGERDRISEGRKSLFAEDPVSGSVAIDWKLVGGRPVGSSGGGEDGGSEGGPPATEGALAVGGRSSGTVDCLLARWSSSASSAISMRRRLRRELVDEEVDPDAVCREHAAERVVSRSSFEVATGKTGSSVFIR
jgi:hypothetical protein